MTNVELYHKKKNQGPATSPTYFAFDNLYHLHTVYRIPICYTSASAYVNFTFCYTSYLQNVCTAPARQ